ncbi:MAG TPA: hypothetical protein VGX23_26045 [Actinocrinis sp.]|nr:hypothetical protein [Actinocrinis sp.]
MDLTLLSVARLIYQLGGSQEQATLDQVLRCLAESDGLAAARAIADAGQSDFPREQVLAAATLLPLVASEVHRPHHAVARHPGPDRLRPQVR